MPLRVLALAILGLTASACTQTPAPIYAPAYAHTQGFGYDAYRMDEQRWRVWFTAPGAAEPAVLERLALRRAAELTQQAEYAWFIVEDRDRFHHEAGDRPDGVSGMMNHMGASQPVEEGWMEARMRQARPGSGPAQSVSLEIRTGRGVRPGGAYDATVILGTYPG